MTDLQALVNNRGQVQFGLTPAGVSKVNYQDYALRSAMDRPLPHWRRYWSFNQFQFIALSSPELLVGVAIADLKLISNAFVYLYSPVTGDFDEFSFLQPFARNTSISISPESGTSRFRKGGRSIIMGAQNNVRQLQVDLPDQVRIDASFSDRAQQEPLGLCTRSGYAGWTYTHKNTALPCSGSINWKGRHYSLEDLNTLASIDWSGGFMRRETAWNWASLSTILPDGRRLGLNLAAGVNETGFSENMLWLDGTQYPVDLVDFQFNRQDHNAPWRIRSRDGAVDLNFSPCGKRQEKINAIIIASNFRQFFGHFDGEIKAGGTSVKLARCLGVTEDHYARW